MRTITCFLFGLRLITERQKNRFSAIEHFLPEMLYNRPLESFPIATSSVGRRSQRSGYFLHYAYNMNVFQLYSHFREIRLENVGETI